MESVKLYSFFPVVSVKVVWKYSCVNPFWTTGPRCCNTTGLRLPREVCRQTGEFVCGWVVVKLCMWIVYTLRSVFVD